MVRGEAPDGTGQERAGLACRCQTALLRGKRRVVDPPRGSREAMPRENRARQGRSARGPTVTAEPIVRPEAPG